MHWSLSSVNLYFFLLLTALAGCSEKHQEEGIDESVPADFRSFYRQFLKDSSYQLEHIAFPLQGLRGSYNTDTSLAFIPWQKDSWKMHRSIANISDYQHTFDILSEDLIVETIEERNAPIAMQRRFARMANGWNLIYYVEMQPMSKKRNE